MHEVAATEFNGALEEVIALLKTSLKEDFDNKMTVIGEYFAKMLDEASKTPRADAGPLKVKLQREVLDKLSTFDGLLGEYRTKDGDLVVIKDLVDLTDMKDDDELDDSDDIESSSESEDGEEEIGEMASQDDVNHVDEADIVDFVDDGLPEADMGDADYPIKQEDEDQV
jgi:hypothetical protein